MTRNEMKLELESVLSQRRFNHSVNVMNMAMDLADKHGMDKEKAGIAGLLHDCAREIRGEEIFVFCKKYEIGTDYITTAQPELLHGPIGSYIARDKYGVMDSEILGAIRWHTTGSPNMSMLDKIIFMADYIEPNRSFPGIEEVRNEAFANIDRALVMALDRTIKYIITRCAYIHPDTINARNWLIRDLEKTSDWQAANKQGYRRR